MFKVKGKSLGGLRQEYNIVLPFWKAHQQYLPIWNRCGSGTQQSPSYLYTPKLFLLRSVRKCTPECLLLYCF